MVSKKQPVGRFTQITWAEEPWVLDDGEGASQRRRGSSSAVGPKTKGKGEDTFDLYVQVFGANNFLDSRKKFKSVEAEL